MKLAAPKTVAIRIYEPLSLSFPKETVMPARLATVEATPCLFCETHSHLPPSKMVWVSADGVETMGMVCGGCDVYDDKAELEAAIHAKFRDEPPAPAIAAE